jgi:peptidoglycan-associated lipoprotein
MTTLDRPGLASCIAIALVVALTGCGPKRKPALATPGADGSVPPSTEGTTDRAGQGPDVQALEGESPTTGRDIADTSSLTSTGEGGPLDDVRFDYDSAKLSDTARAALDRHAVWLQSHRDTSVTIEGHCDARGTVEYNLALGDQRARAVRDYLVSLGIAAERLRAVSFGKEQPVDPAPTEEAYARNRRAHFAVSR